MAGQVAIPAGDLLEMLPLAQRLALSYAPSAAREATLTLLLLDQRLAGIVRRKSEVLLAQLKLAWWRDRFAEDRARWPVGEPLLERLAGWQSDPASLAPLVDAWEALLGVELGPPQLREFAEGRAAGWVALARELGCISERDSSSGAVVQAAREWARADLALHLGPANEAQSAREVALAEMCAPEALPRALRPLAVLRALGNRALRRGEGEMLAGPSAGILALRIGLLGR